MLKRAFEMSYWFIENLNKQRIGYESSRLQA